MNKKIKFGIISLAILVVVLILVLVFLRKDDSEGKLNKIEPVRGDISLTVSTVGTVKPQNRLEIMPPIGGRIEEILVKEGGKVKVGDILALMSSTERATLIDAARLKGAEEFKYWKNAYKETPLVAPIDGVVIVRGVEPGQTVTTSTAVLVLSDRLIIEADFDETDISEVKLGQGAVISLDAYPEIRIEAAVDHISYESEIVNNVTIYKVDILPQNVPDLFRSGMSANVEVVIKENKNALLVPLDAVFNEDGEKKIYVKDPDSGDLKKVVVNTGLQKDELIEITSGLSDDDIIFAPKNSYAAPKKKNGTNPFLPSFKMKKIK